MGVWMDHAEAKCIEAGETAEAIHEVHSDAGRIRDYGQSNDGIRMGNFRSTNNEYKKHIRKQNDELAFFKELANELLPYDEILIFGPTTAGKEFYNYLIQDKQFAGRRILQRHEDYMTDNQIAAYVSTHLK